MGTHLRRLLVVLLGVMASVHAQAAPITWTPLDAEWTWLEDLARRGLLEGRLAAGTFVFDPADARRDSEPAAARLLDERSTLLPDRLGATLQLRVRGVALTTDPARQLRPLFLDVREGDAVDPALRHRTQLVGAARLQEHLSAGVHFSFDSHGDNDPLNRTRRFTQLDASNNFDAAWIRAELGAGAITLGRVPLNWGPERLGGLILSDTAPAPDMIHGALRWGPHRLQTFAGQLSSSDVDGENTKRWLYGHRADLFFLDGRLRVALSETVVSAGPNESLNLRYLNPIPLWAQIQVESDGDNGIQVNVIDMVDGEFVHGLGSWTSRWYGSLAVDDVQIDPEGRDRNPDQLAWSAGVDVSRGPWLLGYEYRRLGTWTYLHRGLGSGHTTYLRPLGAPEGPDTDRHDLRVDWRPEKAWRLWASGERWRRGENRISTTDPKVGNVGLPFPHGVVEKRWILGLGAEWAWTHDGGAAVLASVGATLHSIENVNNVAGEDEDVWELRAVLDLRAPALRWLVD